jgi:alcohol dehydrogenase
VLVLGGGAKSIGLYAAGLAVAHGASVVDYLDRSSERRRIAESFGARARPYERRTGATAGYDVVVEATSSTSGLQRAVRAIAPGGICTAVGYYIASATRVPLMHMYATDATLHLGVSHSRAIIPDVLNFVHRTGFPAERVTTLTAEWEDAPASYAARTTKVVLQRERIKTEEQLPS